MYLRALAVERSASAGAYRRTLAVNSEGGARRPTGPPFKGRRGSHDSGDGSDEGEERETHVDVSFEIRLWMRRVLL